MAALAAPKVTRKPVVIGNTVANADTEQTCALPRLPNESPADELVAAQGGNPGARRSFFEHVHTTAFRRALSDRLRHHDAENIAQEVCLKVLRKLETINPNQHVDGYLATVYFNAKNDFLRKKYREKVNFVPDEDLAETLVMNENETAPDRHIMLREAEDKIQQAKKNLIPPYQEALKAIEEYDSGEDAAAALRYNTVTNFYSTVSRAKTALKERVRHHFPTLRW